MRNLLILYFLLYSLFISAQIDTLYYDSDYNGVMTKESCEYWRVADYSSHTFTDYYNTGEVKSKGKFSFIDKKNDLETRFEGEFVEFYKNGDVEGCYEFKDGMLNGRGVTYFPSGKIRESGFYKDWEKHGLFEVRNSPNDSIELAFYVNDKRSDFLSEPYRIMMALRGGVFDNRFGVNFEKGKYKKEYKAFDKYLGYFDSTKDSLGNTAMTDASVFWNTLIQTNPNYRKFHSKEPSKKVLEKVSSFRLDASKASGVYSSHPRLFEYYDDKFLCEDFISFFQGSDPIKPVKSVRLEGGNSKNAFVFPDGTICITLPLFYELSAVELLGVLAHEMAHYTLDHAIVSKFKVEKREKENRVAAAILAGINTFASAYVQANGGVKQEDSKEYWDNVSKNNLAFLTGFDKMTERFGYRYSREQEMEADMIAYRFLQYMGYDPRSYIRALEKIIGFDRENPTPESIEALSRDYHSKDKYSDHPSILERCMMLEYIELYDKERNALKQTEE